MSNLVIPGEDGKMKFIGKEEVGPPVMKRESSQLECPTCHQMFDFLLGETVLGCETDYVKENDKPSSGNYQGTEIE